MATILTISSFVTRGHVGNSALVFPLMRLGHEVRALPTVILAHHPGHAPDPARADIHDLAALGEDLLTSPAPHLVDAVLVGYMARSAQAAAAAQLVELARGLKPAIPLLLDPICGDAGALYVAPAIVGEIRRHLLPIADVATPNVTELAALTASEAVGEAPGWPEDEIIARARQLGPPCVVVTSAPASRSRRAANLVITRDTAHRIETPQVECAVHGTGDLIGGLILAGLLEGQDAVASTARAAAIVHDVLAETARLGRDEMGLAAAQARIVSPLTVADVFEIKQAARNGVR